jgi:nucleoside-diphosphate-sugar epimerase/choline dehydrogenase-like flavoprotein
MDDPASVPSAPSRRAQVLVIGSGAGGATTAATLATRGYDVVVLEEGPHIDTSSMATNSPAAIAQLYRNGGVTPILGRQSIAYVEGRCVGGSTEVNSAFWHRVPEDCYARWRADARLADCSREILEPYFELLERELSVSYLDAAHRPRSSELFRRGIERLQWQYTEVPRCQRQNDASPFAPGNKQSMQRTFLPRAVAAGAQLIAAHKAVRLLHEHGRVRGVLVERTDTRERRRAVVEAEAVFVCCGAVHTAALLRRSGITKNVGNNLCIHPMIKAAALFDEPIAAHQEPLPIYQVKEFWPNVTIGGSVFTPGFLAMLLSDNWAMHEQVMRDWNRMALYYAGTRGMNRGTVRTIPGIDDGVVVRYRLTAADQQNISAGLAHLGEILFAAGAKAVYPSLRSQPVLKSADQCRGFLKQPIPIEAMSLSTVHAFSSCPMGENPDLCATDSFGKVTGFRNLYLNDASIIPDSPGVNPQGTIMALALRNLDHFDSASRRRYRSNRNSAVRASTPPAILITGAPGWLGSRLIEVLSHGLPGVPQLATPEPNLRVRCLVQPTLDPEPLLEHCAGLDVIVGDVTDPAAVSALCADASGAVLFHIAGVVHPSRPVEFERVNVEGTRLLLRAAAAAGVRRVVAVSSNSPFGFNPHPDHVFDEQAPYRPYMGYGRSKHRMELVVQEAQASGAIETVIIRPPWFYGPHQPARQTQFFKMIKEGRFPILGDGSQKRSMAYVDNICQGLLLAASSERANGEAYWIADARPYAIVEIVDTVREVLEEELGVTCVARQLHVPALVGRVARTADAALQGAGWYNQRVHVLGEMSETIACSVEKAQRDLGYAPAVALREGMRASIRWCLDNGVRL